MWNIKAINPICLKKKITDDQSKLLVNIQNARKRIDNEAPWQPTHSLSKWTNKYTHQTEEKIMYQNNVLLNKMMDIQKQGNTQSHATLPQVPQHSMTDALRKREKFKINQENQQRFLKRLQSANSVYGQKFWSQDYEKNQQYRENLLKKTKTNDDYTELVRKQQKSQRGSRSQLRSQQVGRPMTKQQQRLERDEDVEETL